MKVEQLFHLALEQPVDRRAAYLDAACGRDADLRQRVEELLRAHANPGSFLAPPPVDDSGDVEATLEYPMQEQVGATIANYKLMELIGEGGMGLVYVAEQERPVRRKVALKIIRPGMDTREFVARFEAERQALALMDHPNIAKVLDAGATESGRPYFVMELIRGTPILEYCDKNELTTQERLALFVDACRAVQHAHAKGVIHRDLKPSNILVSPHDGVPVVKVIDFGIAKAIGQQLTDRTIYTRLSQMIGTPLYMSPEQAEINALDIDTRSDIYSLGVLLYEALVGTPPFDRDRFSQAAYEEIKRIIREEEPPLPSKRLSTLGDKLKTVSLQRKTEPTRLVNMVRGELDWIVMCCLEKDRSRRYQTAHDLAADVERYLRDEPVTAVPPTRFYRAKKFIRRQRAPLAVAAGFLLTSVIFLTVYVSSQAKYKSIALAHESVLLDRAFNQAVNGDLRPALATIESLGRLGASEQLTETLRGIAYSTYGDMGMAVKHLQPLANVPDNYLARTALVFTYYQYGEVAKSHQLYERLAKDSNDFGGATTDLSDLELLFHARATTYATGDAHEKAISILTDEVIARHRLWGFAYYARMEAYGDKFVRTKAAEDLQAALDDERMATLLLPNSDMVKSASLLLHLNAIQFASAFPQMVDHVSRERWRRKAEALAEHFASRLSDWEGAACAVSYYRGVQNDAVADDLERRIERQFSRLQPIRDGLWFQSKDYDAFRLEQNKGNPFTLQLHSLLLFEKGEAEAARKLIDLAVDQSKGSADALISAIEVLQLMQEFDKCEQLAREYVLAKDRSDLWEWSVFALKYQAGDISEEELLAMVEPFEQLKCMAHWCVGVSHLSQGEREIAERHFETVMGTGRIGWGSYERSKAYLRRLEENPKWPEWIE